MDNLTKHLLEKMKTNNSFNTEGNSTIIRLEKSNLHAIFLLLPSVALLPAGRRRFGDRRAAVTVDEGAVQREAHDSRTPRGPVAALPVPKADPAGSREQHEEQGDDRSTATAPPPSPESHPASVEHLRHRPGRPHAPRKSLPSASWAPRRSI